MQPGKMAAQTCHGAVNLYKELLAYPEALAKWSDGG